jgi:hypothetical protein
VDRRRFLRTTVAAAGGVVLAAGVARRLAEEAAPPVEQPVTASPPGLPEGPYRAFSDRSEWNRPLPPDAPVDARSDAFVQELLRFDPGTHSIRLAMGIWAEPIYWAGAGDPEVRVEPLPNPVRIPEHATPAPSRDAQRAEGAGGGKRSTHPSTTWIPTVWRDRSQGRTSGATVGTAGSHRPCTPSDGTRSRRGRSATC